MTKNKIDFEEAIDLIYDEILQEERENFTSEFRNKVVKIVRYIRVTE